MHNCKATVLFPGRSRVVLTNHVPVQPADTNLNGVAKGLLKKLPDMPADFFTEDCLYRDMLAMSQSIRTIYGMLLHTDKLPGL